MTLEQLFEHGANFARMTFERNGEVLPMWIGETKDGTKVPICVPMLDKDRLVEMLKTAFEKFDVVQYVSMLESWTVKAPKGADKEAILTEVYKHGSLADHPDREEVVWIYAEDKDGAMISGALWIKRDDDGVPTISELERMPKGESSEGRFTNLLGGNRGTVQ